MNRLLKLLGSMKFAVVILIIMAVASTAGTLIQQGAEPEFYTYQYGDTFGSIILALNLNDAYHAWWFAALLVILCISLLVCIVTRTKSVFRSISQDGFKKSTRIIGSWVLHIGVLMLVLFFGLDGMFSKSDTVYNVPGEECYSDVFGVTVAIDDFKIELREDTSVENYISDIRVLDQDKEQLLQGNVLVNHPLVVNGLQISQTSYGPALDVRVYKNDEHLGDAVLFSNEFVDIQDGLLTLEFVDFSYELQDLEKPTEVHDLNMQEAQLLYRLYSGGKLVDMNTVQVGEDILFDSYRLTVDNPRYYTLLTLQSNPFSKGVLAGSLILLFGIILVIFSVPQAKGNSDKVEQKL